MKRKLLTALIVVAGIIGGILLYATTQPDSFRMERKTVIQAPPEKVFTVLNDFHHWDNWSPWSKLDPEMKKTFSGSESGVGAIYEWSGNNKVGSGRMEITESASPSKVLLKLDFITPMEGHNMTEFTVAPVNEGQSSEVTWAMYGPSLYMHKVMTLFVSMDKMVGKDFEKGFANLKALTEK